VSPSLQRPVQTSNYPLIWASSITPVLPSVTSSSIYYAINHIFSCSINWSFISFIVVWYFTCVCHISASTLFTPWKQGHSILQYC
jgi:hypothetical protein